MTEFQHTPSSLLCFIDKDIAGTGYISPTGYMILVMITQPIQFNSVALCY